MTEAATIAPAPAPLKAPFLWFGGKSRAASVIWRAIAEAFDVSSSTVALGRQGAHVEGDGMGRILIVHYITPKPVPGMTFVKAWGLSTGFDMPMRAVTLYERDGGAPSLFPEPPDSARAAR